MIPGTLTGQTLVAEATDVRAAWFPKLIEQYPVFACGVYIIEGMYYERPVFYVGMSTKNPFSRVFQGLTTGPLKEFDPRMMVVSVHASENPIAEELHWINKLRPLFNSQTRGTYTEAERADIIARYRFPASFPFPGRNGMQQLIPLGPMVKSGRRGSRPMIAEFKGPVTREDLTNLYHTAAAEA